MAHERVVFGPGRHVRQAGDPRHASSGRADPAQAGGGPGPGGYSAPAPAPHARGHPRRPGHAADLVPARRSPSARAAPVPFRLLADERCDGDLVLLLRRAGHDVRNVAEGDAGRSDDEVLRQAVREDRVFAHRGHRLRRARRAPRQAGRRRVLLRLAGEPPAVKAAPADSARGARRPARGHHVWSAATGSASARSPRPAPDRPSTTRSLCLNRSRNSPASSFLFGLGGH